MSLPVNTGSNKNGSPQTVLMQIRETLVASGRQLQDLLLRQHVLAAGGLWQDLCVSPFQRESLRVFVSNVKQNNTKHLSCCPIPKSLSRPQTRTRPLLLAYSYSLYLFLACGPLSCLPPPLSLALISLNSPFLICIMRLSSLMYSSANECRVS